jgi:hypothetical protein
VLRPAAASARAFHECTIMLCQKNAFVSLRSGIAKCCPAQSKVRLESPAAASSRRPARVLSQQPQAESHDSITLT